MKIKIEIDNYVQAKKMNTVFRMQSNYYNFKAKI